MYKLCVFLSAQFIFQIVVTLLEALLNLVGLTAFAAIEMASTTGISVRENSPFRYTAILCGNSRYVPACRSWTCCRKSPGSWALPGGFANENEPVEVTAARELLEETGVEGLELQLVGIFSAPGRDPRGWVVSAAYLAVADAQQLSVRAGDDAADALWYTVSPSGGRILLHRDGEVLDADDLAFDHGQILRAALEQLKYRTTPPVDDRGCRISINRASGRLP